MYFDTHQRSAQAQYSAWLTATQSNEEERCPRTLVLLDRDPKVRERFQRVARIQGDYMRAYSSLIAMTSFAHLKSFDAIILDFSLENLTGVEIAEYVDAFFPDIPVFLIGQPHELESLKSWPACIRRCFAKTLTANEILEQIHHDLQLLDMYEKMRQEPKLRRLS